MPTPTSGRLQKAIHMTNAAETAFGNGDQLAPGASRLKPRRDRDIRVKSIGVKCEW